MFFIRDCNGKVVGNPRGYRTFRGATQQQDMRGSPAHRAIWDAFYAKYTSDVKQNNLLISSINRDAP